MMGLLPSASTPTISRVLARIVENTRKSPGGSHDALPYSQNLTAITVCRHIHKTCPQLRHTIKSQLDHDHVVAEVGEHLVAGGSDDAAVLEAHAELAR